MGWPWCLGSQMVVGFDSESDATEARRSQHKTTKMVEQQTNWGRVRHEVGTVSANQVTGRASMRWNHKRGNKYDGDLHKMNGYLGSISSKDSGLISISTSKEPRRYIELE